MQVVCQATGSEFIISQQEIDFYDRISPVIDGEKFSIPAPQFCPEFRCMLRTLHRNEQYLYHRASDHSKKPIISLYASEPISKYKK